MAPLNLSLNSSTLSNEICFSNSCIETAASLLQSMNMNVDPCSDFYQYTCGNWIKNAVIPEELAGFGVLEVESTNHKNKLRTILDGSYNDLLKSTISKSSFQVDSKTGIERDKTNFKVIKQYYSSCIDIESSDDTVLSSFFQDIYNLQNEVELLESNNSTFQINSKIMEIINYPKSSDGISIEAGGLFTIDIFPDDLDKSKMTLAMSPSSELRDIEKTSLKEHGAERLFEIATSLFSAKNVTERDRNRIYDLEEAGLKVLSESEIYSIIDDAISVQNKLIQLSKNSEDIGRYVYTLDTLIDFFPFMDWQAVFYANIPKNRDISNITIQIDDLKYFSQLNYFFNVTDPTRILHKDGIVNYLIIHKILQDGPKLDTELRQMIPDTPFQTRSSLCVDKVLDNFGLVAGRYYSMVASAGESDRLKLEEMAEAIKESLGNRIKNADWLDNSTEASAMRKLNAMGKSIGYSITTPDERSPQDIQNYLRGLKTNASNFYENEKAVIKWIMQTYWDTVGRPLKPTEWIGIASPQVVNAFNLLSKNSIVVSTAFAQKPNYDQSYPDYLNYGGIGQTLGHEYSHGFDDYGSQYDEFGIDRNWWSKETKRKYTEKAQCFVEQYSKATVIDTDGKRYSVDGSLTLGENIADNEGLSATFDAYLKSKKDGKGYNPILPGLQAFSPEALFFINAGRSFCSKPLDGTVKDSLNDEHAPDSIRANKVFQNNVDFARIFNCPIGSKMNPKTEKCRIW